uniref:ABC transporter ok isoform A CRISPR/Cas9 mutant 3 n=1 Tax=Helicoverpa armigera TaxID=29058 RepID=A0A1C8V615_HELAM|nr:ABC transporter ok isoform A CRISPR/Cas9 mutant 3 [Helicoverpa armigera]ANW09750.1 ABC transporter ok isoform B CRISPR/Cas9 mutant 3 [Helicoverpa armigera]
MKDTELKLPTRNVLTGAVVNWEDDELGFGDSPNNLTLARRKHKPVFGDRRFMKKLGSYMEKMESFRQET